ncbi:hypothetical protein GCM10028808_15810 [Spirosoma migulaei]
MNVMLKLMNAFLGLVGLLVGGLVLLSCGPSSRKGYRIEKGDVVLYTGWPANRAVIGEADAASFTAINDEYGKDKNHAFYLGKIIPNSDPITFTYLAGSYSKDKARGYSRDQVISTDGPHFTIVPNPNETATNVSAEGIAYARDSRQVYKDVMPINGADPATFVVVPMFNGYYLTHDSKRVYFQDRPMEGVDGATFRKVSDFNFNDKHGAWGLELGRYTTWKPLEHVDLATFTGVGKYYSKDKQHVYFSNYEVKGADPVTFQETEYLQGKDKYRIYSSGYSATNQN